MIATAAVIAMAAAAVYGSTQEMSQTQDTGERLQLFRAKETIYCWYSDEALSGYINAAAVSIGEQNKVRVIPVLTSDSGSGQSGDTAFRSDTGYLSVKQ